MNNCKRDCVNNKDGQCIALQGITNYYTKHCKFYKTSEEVTKKKKELIAHYEAINDNGKYNDVINNLKNDNFKGDYMKVKMEVMKGDDNEWLDL